MNAPFNIAEQRKTTAEQLRALANVAARAADAADRDDYFDSPDERAVLNAIYDLTDCDAIYDSLTVCDDPREPLWNAARLYAVGAA